MMPLFPPLPLRRCLCPQVFSTMFGGMGMGMGGMGGRRASGPDVKAELHLSFREAISGCSKTVVFRAPQRCADCSKWRGDNSG